MSDELSYFAEISLTELYTEHFVYFRVNQILRKHTKHMCNLNAIEWLIEGHVRYNACRIVRTMMSNIDVFREQSKLCFKVTSQFHETQNPLKFPLRTSGKLGDMTNV
ncbi:unnamed protein product [Chrysodeixis includens]|uniref:Uncharacterized protein n=1 Tax=Chrysodeixis includens TaxID=689277 RepID=A0A9P0BKH3_CHRIL|nr:unnamed protein product [Chrysodeixis includens]